MNLERIALFIGCLVLSLSLFGQSDCIDLRDLNAPYIHCTWGTFEDPYQNQGVCQGHHTVITDPLATDPRTREQLHQIPFDETYSISLGDWAGSSAESISVDIDIDTNRFDLLILKYAAVLEDPGHFPEEQPKFTFEILDMQNQLVDTNCLSAVFISSPQLGWNNNYPVYWKDWTHVGMDLTDFHGQTIRVRLTTYDCARSVHFGHAYFLLTCGDKSVENISCGSLSLYKFRAPDGFNYRWYRLDDPGQTLSTDRTVVVPYNTTGVLRCHCSFIDNNDCSFEIAVNLDTISIENHYPIAGFSIEETSCTRVIHFIDESFVSLDGINPDGTGNHCENILWNFGDGHTSTVPCPTHEYRTSGDFTVTMIAGLDNCSDTTYQIVHIPEGTRIDTLVCDAFVWNGTTLTDSGVYSHTYDTEGDCDSLVEVHLTVVNSDVFLRDTTACDLFVWNDSLYLLPGSYTQSFPSAHGCDSTVTLNLDLNYTPFFDIHGAHYVVGGSEWGFTEYTYQLILGHQLCQVDSVTCSVDNPNMSVLPSADGTGVQLRVFTLLTPTDSVALHVTVHNRCGTEERTFWIHTTGYGTGEHPDGQHALSVFPNPNAGVLSLRLAGFQGAVAVEVFNTSGLKVLELATEVAQDEALLTVDCSRLPDGVYTLRVRDDAAVITRKTVIRR